MRKSILLQQLRSRSIAIFFFAETIAANFLERGFGFAEHRESVHLIDGILLADFAHRKSHMNQDPVTFHRLIGFKQTEIHAAAYAGDLHERKAADIAND